MAPNGPQNDKNAIQILQITIFHDNSGAAQILQIQILFASKIAANTNRIRITRIWLIPKYKYEYYSYLLTALNHMKLVYINEYNYRYKYCIVNTNTNAHEYLFCETSTDTE